jgi:uncharacterized protein (DUF2236 family)
MMRSAGKRPFGKETVTLLTMLAPHLKQALNTHRMLTVSRDRIGALRQSVEALDVAVIALDRAGQG